MFEFVVLGTVVASYFEVFLMTLVSIFPIDAVKVNIQPTWQKDSLQWSHLKGRKSTRRQLGCLHCVPKASSSPGVDVLEEVMSTSVDSEGICKV
jgi:hypothetical protein